MRRIKDWIAEAFTGKRYIMGSYRKVSARKPLRIIVIYIAMLAIITGLGAIVTALM